MRANRCCIPVHATVTGRRVLCRTVRLHVASLAFHSPLGIWTRPPLRKSLVSAHAEQGPLMATRTVVTRPIQRRERVITAIHVVTRAEEHLRTTRRPHNSQRVTAVLQSERIERFGEFGIRNLVAKI